MSNKAKTSFVCTQCGENFTRWQGSCTSCGAWGTVSEFREPARRDAATPRGVAMLTAQQQSKPRSIGESAQLTMPARIPSDMPDVDRVLGGGLVAGGATLLGGDPGIGKSTIMLQLLGGWAAHASPCLYITGEESAEQIYLRSHRLGISHPSILVLAETSVEAIIAHLTELKPAVVIIDSIQTMFTEALDSAAGSVSQLRECAAALVRHAKSNGMALILIGHVTKEGTIAGPRLLEHMVDTVLSFEGETHYQYRILRTIKNRYGPSGEIAIFTMHDTGLTEVSNASEFFLNNRTAPQIGTAISPVLEGTRILLVELQSLVNRTHFGLPQRVASGINPKKLSLLIAVLERHGGIMLGDHDIFFNIAGGLSVEEPSIDCGIVASILSSFRNKPLRPQMALVGECGLGGELRTVNHMDRRIKECARLGFTQCVVPEPHKKAEWKTLGETIELKICKKVKDLQDILF